LASFGPTSASPGLVYFNQVPLAVLRIHDAATGAELKRVNLGHFAMASMPTVRDGTVLIGESIGPGAISGFPADLTALCVPGTAGCAACNDGQDNDDDGNSDFPADSECTSAADVSELPECEDGFDNDHEGDTDFPDDPGCRNRMANSREAPECDDGIDNDKDGNTDLVDGSCVESWWVSEAAPPAPQPTLTPPQSLHQPGESHTVTTAVADQFGDPYPGLPVTFDVFAGPNTGTAGTCTPNADCTTDLSGTVSFTYVGVGGAGEDEIIASIQNSAGATVESNTVLAIWNTPPDCSEAVAEPSELWPPNHKMNTVAVADVNDDDGDPITVTIDSIRQDEPVETSGDGNTAPDGTGLWTDTARVRAERVGDKNAPGDGRVYHISFDADDGRGGACSGSVTVCVPHDRGRGRDCVDQGPLFDSTALAPAACGLGFEFALLLPPIMRAYRRRRKVSR
ncbi:MAG: hypothetical protein JRG80_13880, partial [Deltaproteobacteria bacterium]|nr:hypothetical protein [Deltaproteobacteria bacterium]